jgi:hypothetical protein
MYVDYIEFECDFHNVFIYPDTNKDKSEAILPFCITKEDIQLGFLEWHEEYHPLFSYEKSQLEMWIKRYQENKSVATPNQ